MVRPKAPLTDWPPPEEYSCLVMQRRSLSAPAVTSCDIALTGQSMERRTTVWMSGAETRNGTVWLLSAARRACRLLRRAAWCWLHAWIGRGEPTVLLAADSHG